ncbi:MAG TPA: FkbM family methyltransferase, partial [Chloroflexota bacterium]|nr:FkbM family methyltransferase [Chloroflexota bacterium]
IPPHLHFREPNPLVPWADLPLTVPTSPTPWPANGAPRLAGLSSFGFSGTNAHLIVEEAPPVEDTESREPWQMLPLSAKTADGLEHSSMALGAYLAERKDLHLADVTYTLQTGRTAFDHRQVLVCRDLDDAAGVLMSRDPRRLLAGEVKNAATNRAVAFMFPGLGDHYVDMGWGLYQSQPTFRQHVDRCADLLRPHLNLDLRDVLYPGRTGAGDAITAAAEPAMGLDLRQMLRRGGPPGEATNRLNQTALAQPATFVVEYAAAQLWLSWGIRPQAMIGYSIGEYVAACLAGVLALEDALVLVARRGRLIQELPAGSMLAVPLPKEDVQPLLSARLSLSAVNGPALCVVAGPLDDVETLYQQLTAQGIPCRMLQTSHAFHSWMMEPIVPAFRELVATFTLRPPTIPFISNVTGRWITAAEATDPDYWARHLCRAVRFGDGVAELWRKEGRILLEIGPGQTLCSLALQHPSSEQATERVALPSLRPVYDRQPDMAFLLRTVGQLWLSGVEVDWDAFHGPERRRRVPLPTYPFARQRYWFAPSAALQDTPGPTAQGRATGVADWISAVSAQADKKPDSADWFYLPLWKQVPPLLAAPDVASPPSACWLIFADTRGIAAQVADRLRERGQAIVSVSAGTHFGKIDAHSYALHPGRESDYAALVDDIRARGHTPSYVIYAWSLLPEEGSVSGPESFEAAQRTGFYALLFLMKALEARVLAEQIHLWVIANGLHAVTSGDPLRPEQAPLLGLCTVLSQEYAATTCRVIDVHVPPTGSRPERALIQHVMAELAAPSSDHLVAYRGRQRWVRTFEPVRLETPAALPARLRQGGVYLITGGLGRLGLIIAQYLARRAEARLILIGRSGLPARETWGEWLATHGEDDRVSAGIRTLQELEALGTDVLVLAADVADEAAMRAAIATTEQRFGALHGVIHAAGLVGPETLCPIADMTMSDGEKQFRAKVHGLYVLETVLGQRQLDFCLLLSSIATVLGGLGLAAYAAANCFMDAFAGARQDHHFPWISVNWGEAETPEEVGEIMGRLLAQRELTQVLFSPMDLAPRIARSRAVQASTHVRPAAAAEPAAAGGPIARANVRTPYVAPAAELEIQIVELWQELLGVEQVGIHDNFFQLGGHSLIATRLIARLRQSLRIDLSLRTLFEAPTVAGLVLAIEEQLLEEIEGLSEDEAVRMAAAAPPAAMEGPPAAVGNGASPLHYVLPNRMRIIHLSKAETDHFYEDIFEHHVYVRHGITLPEGACVFDVGANIGLFTLYAHQLCPTAMVYAFEPAPALFALLQTNAAQHGVPAKLFNCGLAAAPGTAAFTFYP